MSEVALIVEREAVAVEAEQSTPADENIIRIGGRAVDVSRALPLKVGDWRKLSAKGVDLTKMSKIGEDGTPRVDLGFEQMCVIVSHVLHKADPSLPPDVLDDLDLDELGSIAAKAMGGSAKADRPT